MVNPFTNRKTALLLFALFILFLLRLGFGLCSEFWYEDEQQIYLLGLKYYSTGMWPYFGPDVTFGIELPGALQALLVAVPLFILPVVEAPFVLLNVLSFSGLCLFAWYCTARLPDIPPWIIWLWLLTAPWTLNYSTHVVNPSYVLVGGILFFVGTLEIFPQTRLRLIRPGLANFMMGFGLCWVIQLHMSWVVLPPYVLAAFYFQFKEYGKRAFANIGWFLLGALFPASLVVPTFVEYGLSAGIGGTTETVAFNPKNVLNVFNLTEGILARFLSFASFEVARFIGSRSVHRSAFLNEHLWLLPFFVVVVAVGIAQPIFMIVRWFSKNHSASDWRAIKYLTLFTVILLYGLFTFAIKPPSSHTFYVTLPLAMIYAFYCASPYLTLRRWQICAGIVIACGIVFHVGLAMHNYSRISLYVNRDLPQSAIEEDNFQILGDRRPGSWY